MVLKFFEIVDTGLSTGKPHIAEMHRAAGFSVREVEVPGVTWPRFLIAIQIMIFTGLRSMWRAWSVQCSRAGYHPKFALGWWLLRAQCRRRSESPMRSGNRCCSSSATTSFISMA